MKRKMVFFGLAITTVLAFVAHPVSVWGHGAPAARAADAPDSDGEGTVVKIRLPERFRLLTDQRFDLRVEASRLQGADAELK